MKPTNQPTNQSYPLSYGLNSISILLQGWILHWITHESWYAIKHQNEPRTDDEKSELFYFCHKFYYNFNGWDTHRKWLISLIIVVTVCVFVGKRRQKVSKKKIRRITKGV